MRVFALFVLLGLGVSAVTSAQASDYPFTLHNRSEGWTITSFQTRLDGEWSKNWLDGNLRAGRSVGMDWSSNRGSCTQRFKVTWADYGPTEHSADFCKLKNLYMLQEGFRTD